MFFFNPVVPILGASEIQIAEEKYANKLTAADCKSQQDILEGSYTVQNIYEHAVCLWDH